MPAAARKPKELRNLKLTEVSLVDAGANPGAHVMLWKRAAPGAPIPAAGEGRDSLRKRFEEWLGEVVKAGARSFDDVFQEQQLREAMYETTEKLWDAFYAFCEANASVLSDEEATDKATKLSTNAAQFKSALDSLLPQLVAAGEDDPAAKRRDPNPQPAGGGEAMKFKTLEEAVAHIEGMETSIAALNTQLRDTTKALAKATAKAEEADPEEAIKSLPAAMQATFREARAATAKLAEMEERELSGQIAKRLGLFKHLPGLEPERFAITLKRVYQGKTTAADGEELLGLFKTWNVALRDSGLFGEIGKRGAGAGAGGEAGGGADGAPETPDAVLAEVDKRAKAIQAKNAGMSHEAAIVKVMEADPDLYDAYRALSPGHRAQYERAA